MLTTIAKWGVIPGLLIACPFLISASHCERTAEFIVCIAAIVFVLRAAKVKKYFRAAGLVTVVVAFSPVFLVFKVFLLLTLACMTSSFAVFTAFRPQPAAVV